MAKTKIRKTLNLLLKVFIIIASYGYILWQLAEHRAVGFGEQIILTHYTDSLFLPSIGLIMFLMLLNWGIESYKWKTLIAKVEAVSFIQAFEAVWTGITVSTFTPNRFGEFIGRAFFLKKASPWEGAFISMIGSISQMIVTLILGMFGGLIFLYYIPSLNAAISTQLYAGIVSIVLILVFVLLFFYFNIYFLTPILGKISGKAGLKIREHIRVFSLYSLRELGYILLLSFIRYVVFTTQFYLLFRIFGVPIPFMDGILLITVLFFIMAAIPTFAISELGVRGSISIGLIGMFSWSHGINEGLIESGTMAAALFIWLINLVLPSIAGSFFVHRLRFYRKSS